MTQRSPNEWQKLQLLVDQVLDVALERRAALIDHLSGGNAVRRDALARLVAECERDHRFLEPAAERFAALLGNEATTVPDVLAERYRITRELGRGGMAIVYMARDIKHDRDVAVKVVRPELAATLGTARFLREIEIAAKLHHPHIVSLYDSGEADGVVYYVMPYEDGVSLRQKLVRDGELPIPDAVRILRDVADALAYAHHQKVVHRDIKPENVMLTGRHAMVTDFGVAKAVSDATDRHALTTAGVALGTPAYMAPEQIAADPRVDHRADIYAFGVMAYELLTGQPPFVRSTMQAVLGAHMTEPAAPVTERRASIPVPLATLVMKCLEKKPADRWQNADELLREIETLAAPSASPLPVAAPRARWKSKAAILLGVLTGAALGIAAWQFGRDRSDRATDRIVVARFQNLTGVDSLDALGAILADLITSGLSRTGIVNVVPAVSLAANSGQDGKPVPVDPSALARDTRAGFVVTGSYFLQADSLVIQPQILDVRRARALLPIDRVTVAIGAKQSGILTVLDRVMITLASSVDARLTSVAPMSDLPMTMAAYREFATGVERYFMRDYSAARDHFYSALRLDSTSAGALLWAAQAEWSDKPNLPTVDSLLRIVARFKSELLPHDLAHYEWLRAYLDGDHEGVLRAARKRFTLGSGLAVVQANIRLNRLDEALALITERMELPINQTNPTAWEFLTHVRHMRGEHRRELRDARRGVEAVRSTGSGAVIARLMEFEISALAALGRTSELKARLNDLKALQPSSASFGSAARELRSHGHTEAADEVGRLAAQWYRESFTKSPSQLLKIRLAQALFERQQWDSARTMFQELLGERERAELYDNDSDVDDRDVMPLGYLGIDAAQRGDASQAEATIQQLGGIERPYLQGINVYWQSRIAAQLGECERTIGFLQEAQRRGTTIYDGFRMEAHEFMPLRRCQAFRKLLESKG